MGGEEEARRHSGSSRRGHDRCSGLLCMRTGFVIRVAALFPRTMNDALDRGNAGRAHGVRRREWEWCPYAGVSADESPIGVRSLFYCRCSSTRPCGLLPHDNVYTGAHRVGGASEEERKAPIGARLRTTPTGSCTRRSSQTSYLRCPPVPSSPLNRCQHPSDSREPRHRAWNQRASA